MGRRTRGFTHSLFSAGTAAPFGSSPRGGPVPSTQRSAAQTATSPAPKIHRPRTEERGGQVRARRARRSPSATVSRTARDAMRRGLPGIARRPSVACSAAAPTGRRSRRRRGRARRSCRPGGPTWRRARAARRSGSRAPRFRRRAARRNPTLRSALEPGEPGLLIPLLTTTPSRKLARRSASALR